MESDLFNEAYKLTELLINSISGVFIGKLEVVKNTVKALISGGHILLEDVPGVGKTLLADAVSGSISGELKRIQFTADLLPSDVTGVTVYRQHTGEFTFVKGPVFSNTLLADEINRATPRTQSSLLEAMEEKQVTVDGVIHKLDEPFFVIATQNPIELEGTYPLPFSQMDRFLIRLSIGYLAFENEIRMLKDQKVIRAREQIKQVINCQDLLRVQSVVKNIKIAQEIYSYIVSIIHKTRDHENFIYGVSPRAALDLMRFSQSSALMNGRDYVIPDDVKQAAPLILSHRVIVRKGTRIAVMSGENMIRNMVEEVEVPI
ncbi:MAG TPA: MoxR family ATPase [Victivallales bacterium]|nr:MoxR family ATPase [Victivallales bacterium]